jgi:hypothetical protein
MEHKKLIDELGGSTAVSRDLGAETPQVVSNWRRRGVPWRWRVKVAALAKKKRVKVPAGFMGE